MQAGILLGLFSYAVWGLFPLFFKQLQSVPAPELVAHRVVWSFALLGLGLALSRGFGMFRASCRVPRVYRMHIASALMIGANWVIYVWAVNSGRIVESSLGYFLNPLVTIMLGVLFLGERLRLWQGVAVGMAALGVVALGFAYGHLPWISLSLAASFALYGLLKKKAPLGAIHGLFLETCVLVLPAVAYALWCLHAGSSAWPAASLGTRWLLVATGLVTTIPLLTFAAAAVRIPMSMLGFLQYITPSTQFLLGVFLYREPISRSQIYGFAFVWAALAIYAGEGIIARRKS